MLQFSSFCAEKVFIFWVRTSQFLGLILVEFDEKKDRFYHWKFSSTYCILFAIVVSVIHPIILFQFEETMRAHISIFSFTIFVSIATEVIFYFYMVLTYQQQYANRHKIRDMLNGFVFFFRTSKETYKEFETEGRVQKYQCCLFISIFIKLGVFLLKFASFLFLLEGDDFTYWFAFLSFPFIVSLCICNQFFLGILITNYFLRTTNQKLGAITTLINSGNYCDINEKLQNDLEKLSNMHTQLFEFLTNLSDFLGYPMLFSIFNNFLSLAVLAFQTFSTCLTFFLGLNISWDFNELLIIGIFSMFFIMVDIFFHLAVCVNCSNEVSLFCFLSLFQSIY